jgi:hypothetical protein
LLILFYYYYCRYIIVIIIITTHNLQTDILELSVTPAPLKFTLPSPFALFLKEQMSFPVESAVRESFAANEKEPVSETFPVYQNCISNVHCLTCSLVSKSIDDGMCRVCQVFCGRPSATFSPPLNVESSVSNSRERLLPAKSIAFNVLDHKLYLWLFSCTDCVSIELSDLSSFIMPASSRYFYLQSRLISYLFSLLVLFDATANRVVSTGILPFTASQISVSCSAAIDYIELTVCTLDSVFLYKIDFDLFFLSTNVPTSELSFADFASAALRALPRKRIDDSEIPKKITAVIELLKALTANKQTEYVVEGALKYLRRLVRAAMESSFSCTSPFVYDLRSSLLSLVSSDNLAAKTVRLYSRVFEEGFGLIFPTLLVAIEFTLSAVETHPTLLWITSLMPVIRAFQTTKQSESTVHLPASFDMATLVSVQRF